jgi:hypothetical protein
LSWEHIKLKRGTEFANTNYKFRNTQISAFSYFFSPKVKHKAFGEKDKIAYPFSFTSPLKYDFSSAYRTLFLAIDIQLRPDATTVLYRSIEA